MFPVLANGMFAATRWWATARRPTREGSSVMRIRRAATAAAALACTWAGLAAPAGAASGATPDSPPLGALAAPIGLKIGTAVAPDDLHNRAYAKIAGQQFNVVTPENELKWETVEPTRGTYDWSAADRLPALGPGDRAAGPGTRAPLA